MPALFAYLPVNMPNIVTRVPQINQSEIGAAFERELKTGLKLKEKTEREREAAAAREARASRGHKTLPALGRKLNTMPAWEWFRLQQKYGYEELHSREFHRYFNKKFDHLKVSDV